MEFIQQVTGVSIYGPAIRSGVHDKSLNGKKYAINDCIQLGTEVLREIQSNKKTMSIVEVTGVLTWTTIIMTDIIQDIVKVDPTGRTKILMSVFDKAKKEASKDKFTGNRYKSSIDKIDMATKALKKLAPKAEDVINVFADLAKNSLGLMDFAQSSAETKVSLNQAQLNAEKNLSKMIHKLKEIEIKIADDALNDDGNSSNNSVNFTPSNTTAYRLP
jgi:hypothetical protein